VQETTIQKGPQGKPYGNFMRRGHKSGVKRMQSVVRRFKPVSSATENKKKHDISGYYDRFRIVQEHSDLTRVVGWKVINCANNVAEITRHNAGKGEILVQTTFVSREIQ